MKYFILNICLPSLLLILTIKTVESKTLNSKELGSTVNDTLEGILNVFIADDFENQSFESKFQLVCDDGRIYQLAKAVNMVSFRSGDRIRLIGNNLKSNEIGLILKSSDLLESKIDLIKRRLFSPEDNYGEQNYAIILFNFRDDQRKPFTTKTVEEFFFGKTNSANANIKEMSLGESWLNGEIFDNNGKWYTINMDAPMPNEVIDEYLILELARTAADKDIDYQNYKSIVYIMPNQRILRWGGVGTTNPVSIETEDGNLNKHFVAINGILNEFITTHEVLHNFGVGHDSKRVYPEGIYFGEPLDFDPYGNVFSFMGDGFGHISLAFSKYLWPEKYNTNEINIHGSYSVELAAVADTTAHKLGYLQGVTIPRDPTSFWTIEYRDKVGMDSENNWMNVLGPGLVINMQEHEDLNDIQTSLPFQDDLHHPYIIKKNEEFLDPINGFRVKAVGLNTEGLMKVNIEWNQNTSNIRINKRDLVWPKTAVRNHGELLGYTMYNNAFIDIMDTFEVTLYQKYGNGQWETVSGQNRIISYFAGGDTISGFFVWIPQNTGTYHLKIIADSLNQIDELSKFDNYLPKEKTGYQIKVIEDCKIAELTEHIAICNGESYYTWSVPGQYKRTLITSAGCDSIITTNLTVNEQPVVDFFIAGDTLTSADTFTSYQWYDQNGIIQGATSNQFIINKNGRYSLEIMDSNGCTALSGEVDLIKTGTEKFNRQPNIIVSPNPNSGAFILRIENKRFNTYKIVILNELGQILLNKEIHINTHVHEERVELPNLPKGNYILQIRSNDSYHSQKILLQ